MTTLPDLLSQEAIDVCALADYFDDLLVSAIEGVNTTFGPKRLVKGSREKELLPTSTRQLSSYRTRIGTMLEYAISTEMHRILGERYNDMYMLTFVSAHQYPDFYLRDNTLVSLVRIEMKAVDADSDEQAAKFDVATSVVDSERDLVLLIGWEWKECKQKDEPVLGEFPYIFAGVVVPADDLCRERDTRLNLTGGQLVGDQVLVPQRTGGLGPDPKNYGKLWRIIHASRRSENILSESMRKYLAFLREVDAHSPQSRFRRDE